VRISYRTLGQLIEKMNEDQLDSNVTVELDDSECYAAELRIAAEDHDGGLDDGHPVLYVLFGEVGDRTDNIEEIADLIGL
jgi:hypothetical protein